jgi:hypothetical protein
MGRVPTLRPYSELLRELMRKTTDPRKVALLDKIHQARECFERYYSRMKRAFTRMEKERQRIARLQRQLDKLD